MDTKGIPVSIHYPVSRRFHHHQSDSLYPPIHPLVMTVLYQYRAPAHSPSSPDSDCYYSSPSSPEPQLPEYAYFDPRTFPNLEVYRAKVLTQINLAPDVKIVQLPLLNAYIEKYVTIAEVHFGKKQIVIAYELLLKLRYILLAYSMKQDYIKEKEFRNRVLLAENLTEKVEYAVDHQFYPIQA